MSARKIKRSLIPYAWMFNAEGVKVYGIRVQRRRWNQ